MNTEIIWNNFLEKIKERISPLSYDTWFKDTKLYKLDKNTAIIIVPMILHKKHLEENYLDEIEEIFNSITGTNFNFQFKLENEITEDTLEEKIIVMENITSPEFIKKQSLEKIDDFKKEKGLFKLLSVGRFDEAKGFDNAIKALRILHDRGYKNIFIF
mgnify:CR=1 FL=1